MNNVDNELLDEVDVDEDEEQIEETERDMGLFFDELQKISLVKFLDLIEPDETFFLRNVETKEGYIITVGDIDNPNKEASPTLVTWLPYIVKRVTFNQEKQILEIDVQKDSF